jgi:hypothetical protein
LNWVIVLNFVDIKRAININPLILFFFKRLVKKYIQCSRQGVLAEMPRGWWAPLKKCKNNEHLFVNVNFDPSLHPHCMEM